jgi:tRNA-splicing endonuclease subunit sen54 N-term
MSEISCDAKMTSKDLKRKHNSNNSNVSTTHGLFAEVGKKSRFDEAASISYNPYINERTAAESIWVPDCKMVEISKMRGNFWRLMGFSLDHRDFLFPEEALLLLERGQLIITKPDDCTNGVIHPHHKRYTLREFYALVITHTVPFQCYLAYTKLKGLQYIVARHKQEKLVTIESEKFFYDLSIQYPQYSLLDLAVSFDIYPNSKQFSKKKKNANNSKPTSHVIVVTCNNTFSVKLLIQLLDESNGIPLLFAYVSPTGNVIFEELSDALIALDLDNRGQSIGPPVAPLSPTADVAPCGPSCT